jgi:hypothetical protein
VEIGQNFFNRSVQLGPRECRAGQNVSDAQMQKLVAFRVHTQHEEFICTKKINVSLLLLNRENYNT